MESKTPKTVSEKKLKQARLPFQIIRVSPKDSVPACKKLKLDSPLNPPLTNDLETKENIKIKADKQKNSEEKKDTLVNDDEDSIQLIESPSEKKSPEKIKINDTPEIKTSEDKNDKSSPMEIDAVVSEPKKDAEPSSDSSDKNKAAPDSEKLVTSAISDSSKRKIEEEDKAEDSQNKKAKLDVKHKLSIFAKKDSAKKLEEPIADKNREDLKPVNSENDSSLKKAEEITENKNSVDESVKEIVEDKDDSKTGADKKLDEVITVNDESSSDEVKDKLSNEEDSRHSRSSRGSTDRHIIFHDFDAEPSSSSNAEGLVTPKSKKLPEEGSKKKSAKKLTPKQLEREAEVAKRKQEKERLLEEKRKKLEEEKEEKRRKREEKEEERKKLKEERERLKNEEKEKKEEEKRKKEEQRQEEKRKKEEQRLEEKRKKEEEMQKKKEEEELSKKKKFVKEAEAFSSFFKKVDVKSEPAVQTENKSVEETMFMPFTVKPDMRLAPINRNPLDPERLTKFDEMFNGQTIEELYLSELKSKKIIPKKSGDTWPLEEKYDEVVVLEEEIELNEASDVAVVPERKHKNLRAKLLQFHENRRPPYWGTWRKKSKNITARKPFGKDKVFDYEVDSDDEWEEEEPGESLHGSDDEKEPEDDYEVDNDFFVPHGYLSDDENPEDEILSPETQKAKLKLLGEQFDLERNEKTRQLRPITIGCIWFKNDTDEPEGVNPSIIKLLNKRKAVVWGDIVPIIVPEKPAEAGDATSSQTGTPSSSKKIKFPESTVPFLINMLHGNTCSRKKIIQKFLLNWKDGEAQISQSDNNANLLTKACITKKIKELSSWQEFPDEAPASMANKLCWYVKAEFREKYGITDIPLPNKWDDITDVNSDSVKKGSPSLITKFTKVLTAEERKSQLKSKSKARKSINMTQQNSPSDGKKSAKKLLHFWNKQPNQAQSSTAEDMEVCPINPAEPVETATKKATESAKKSDTMPEVVTIHDDSNSAKTENPSTEIESEKLNSVDKKSENKPKPIANVAACSTNNKINKDQKPAVKKRVPILFSAPMGCAIKKQNLAENEKLTVEKNSTDGDPKILNTNKSESETTKPDQESKSEKLESGKKASMDEKNPTDGDRKIAASSSAATDNKTSGENSQPVVKKRVPILFSAPRGCEIKKSNNDSQKAATE